MFVSFLEDMLQSGQCTEIYLYWLGSHADFREKSFKGCFPLKVLVAFEKTAIQFNHFRESPLQCLMGHHENSIKTQLTSIVLHITEHKLCHGCTMVL